MKKSKKAFTIAEMLICFTVIGVLAAMLIPSIVHNRPNKNKAMFRKAYYIIERVTSELIMDDDDFPSEIDGSKGLAYYDTSEGATRTQGKTGEYLCETFARKINTNSDIKCNVDTLKGTFFNDSGNPISAAFSNGAQSFSTNDGIYWFMRPSVMCDPEDTAHNGASSPCNMPNAENPPCPAANEKAPYICLYIDVNGPEGPNTLVSTTDADINRADRGWIYVYWNGKVQAPTGQAARYLKSTSVF